MSKGDGRDITIKRGFGCKLDRGATDFTTICILHVSSVEPKILATTPQRRSQRAYEHRQTRVRMEREREKDRIKRWELKKRKEKGHANKKRKKKKRVPRQQGDG